MSSHDFEYFLERAINEREMAKAAKHPAAIAVHEEMAQRYDALVETVAQSALPIAA